MLTDAEIERLSEMTDAEVTSMLDERSVSSANTDASERVLTALMRNIMTATSEDRTRPPRLAAMSRPSVVAFMPASSIYAAAGAYAPMAGETSASASSAGVTDSFEPLYTDSMHLPYDRSPDTLDILRIVHDLDPEQDIDTWNGDCERGSVECGEALTSMGVCVADLDTARDAIKHVIADAYEKYVQAAAKLDTANRTNDVLAKWMMDFECNIGPHIVVEHGPEHSESTRTVINGLIESMRAVVSHHAEITRIGDLRTSRAHAFGALQRAVRAVKSTPDAIVGSVCCICIDRTCDRANVPCGHVICSTCYAKSNGMVTTCYMCRAPVERVLRLYMN